MSLENMIKKLLIDNPDLGKGETIKRLKKIKNSKTGKSMWRPATIRCHVSTFFNKRERESHAAHVESPAETMISGFDLKIEEKVMERHSPKDPFAIEPGGNAEEKVDRITDKRPVVDIEQFRKEIVDGVSKKVLEQASMDAKPFRDEIISIVSRLKSAMVKVIIEVKEEISNLQTHGIPSYEPAIQYDDLNLKESTIDIIQTNTEEKELEEESDYIDGLIKNEKEYMSVLRVYHKLIDLAKGTKNGVQLRLFYKNDLLSYNKKSVGWFGINPRHLIAGIAIGVPIGIAIWLICTALMAVPPTPLPIPVNIETNDRQHGKQPIDEDNRSSVALFF